MISNTLCLTCSCFYPSVWNYLSIPLSPKPYTPQWQLQLIHRTERGGYRLVLESTQQAHHFCLFKVSMKGAEGDEQRYQILLCPFFVTFPSSSSSGTLKTPFPLIGCSSILLSTWKTCIHFSKLGLHVTSSSLKTLRKELVPFTSMPYTQSHY